MEQLARQLRAPSIDDNGDLPHVVINAPLSVGEDREATRWRGDRELHEKAAAYDALLDALGDDMDRRLAEINAALDRLAA
jgi:hypothetical protein